MSQEKSQPAKPNAIVADVKANGDVKTSFSPTNTNNNTSKKSGKKVVFHVFGDKRKGAKQYQEDDFCISYSATKKVVLTAIYDGHGGYNGLLASSTATETTRAFMQKHSTVCEEWSLELWKEKLYSLFELIHKAIRDKFMSNQHTSHRPGGMFVCDV